MKTYSRSLIAWSLLAAVMALGTTNPASARIKLVTLPIRERVEIQLDNMNATLVEEERIIPLLQGTNQVDFSWSSTTIDKGTVQFRLIDMPLRPQGKDDPASVVRPDGKVEMVRIISLAYPPNENALTWEVYAEQPVAARIRISYLVANLDRSFSYRAIAENNETTLTLRQFMRLSNLSGEEFGDSGIWAGFGKYFHREIGLNEAKELLMWKFDAVPIKKAFTFDWWTCPTVPDEPEQRYVQMRYVLKNDETNGMGRFPLLDGKVRIFQKDGRGGEAFVGEDWGRFTALDGEMKLYLGLARDVVVKRKVTKNVRDSIRGNLYNQELIVQYTVENFKKTPVVLDIVENMNNLRNEFCGGKTVDAEWEILKSETTVPQEQIERKSSSTVEYHVPLDAAPNGDGQVKKSVVTVHVLLRNEW